MRFTVLGSGSTGNSFLIATEKTKVLIDAGLSAREIVRRLAVVGVSPDEIDAIVITHEHSDHVAGLRSFLSKVGCQVFMTDATEDAYFSTTAQSRGLPGESESSRRRVSLSGRRVSIESAKFFRIGDIDFEAFTVPHDAVDNFGLRIVADGARLAALTDFGHVTQLMRDKLRNCDAILIESNHSLDMLRACSVYPWSLKQRIAGRHGHFSNEDLAEWLQTDFDGTAQHVVLAHISQRANDIHLAQITAETALQMRLPLFRVSTKITLSNNREPTDWIDLV